MNFLDMEIEVFLKAKGKKSEPDIAKIGNKILKMATASQIMLCLFNFLNCNNSRTRYFIFELVKHLFDQSESFRKEICPELTKLHRACLLTDDRTKKLRPISFTKKLKSLSMKTFINWYLEYQHIFPQLKILFDVIMRVNSLEARSYYKGAIMDVDLSVDKEKSDYHKRYSEQKEMIKSDIEVAVSCFDKLVPKFNSISETTTPQSHCQPFSIYSPIKISIKTKKDVFISEFNNKTIKLLNIALERCIKFHKPFLTDFFLYFQSEPNENISELNFLKKKIDQIISQYNDLNFTKIHPNSVQDLNENLDETTFIDIPKADETDIFQDRDFCLKIFNPNHEQLGDYR